MDGAPFTPAAIDNDWGPGAEERELTRWLIAHGDFDERPATIEQFMGPDYLDIDAAQNPSLAADGSIRPGVKQALIEIFGTEVNARSISAVREAMFSGGIGVGKQNRKTEPVLTPSGWQPIGDLAVGDRVIGKNGRPTTVLGVYPQVDIQMYRVRFKDGTWIDVGDEHLWEVHEPKSVGVKENGRWRTRRTLVKSVVSTEWLYDQNLRDESSGSYRFRIPLVDPVEFETPFEEVVDAYTLGLFLANGSLHAGSPRLACHAADRDELLRLIRAPGTSTRWDAQSGNNGGSIIFRAAGSPPRRQWSNPLAAAFDRLGMCGVRAREKSAPRSYLTAPPEVRLQLLRGLMDGDGSSYAKNRQVFSSSSPQLAADVADLVRSLGGYCTVTTFDRRGATEHQVHVNLGDVCPFRLSRKVANWKPRTNQQPARSIVSVEKLGREDGVCIKVDAADELYVTKDYIVTHNTTLAAVALSYCVHWVLCLNDPQRYFGLMPGSRIAFMLMSTKDSQAKEVLFGDIKARVNHSKWFRKFGEDAPWKGGTAYDPALKNQLRFPKDIWVLPGNSAETTFEGYNVLVGILDEGDSHTVTENKDYAEAGYRVIKARITSRFTDGVAGKHRGLLITIGQMKKADGFMARQKAKFEKAVAKAERAGETPEFKVVFMSIWESRGWDYYRDPETGKVRTFHFDVLRKVIVPDPVAKEIGVGGNIIEIPWAYHEDFELDPVQALKDHAGIPPAVDDPFISAQDRVEEAQDKWHERFPGRTPVTHRGMKPAFHPDLRCDDAFLRALHVDVAYASHGDAAGMAMGHIPELIEVNGELKPLIVIDFLLRWKPSGGQQLMLEDLRQLIYELRDERKYRMGVVTYDGFQSQDSQQILRRKRFNVAELSVDRNKGPYEDLRQAIYERRILFPRYMTLLRKNDHDPTNVAQKELLELTDTGRKIDHPPKGGKDLADSLAGVVYALMVNNNFRRGAKHLGRKADPFGESVMLGDTVDLADASATDPDLLARLEKQIAVPGSSRPSLMGGLRGLPAIPADPYASLRHN